MDLLVKAAAAFAEGVGKFVSALGVKGFLLCMVGLLALFVAMKFLTATADLLEKLERRWKKLPRWFRQSALIVAGFYFLPGIIAFVPWGSALLAAGVAGLVVLSVGGAHFGKRYGVSHLGPVASWKYHLNAKVHRKRLAEAINKGTHSEGAQVLKKVKLDQAGDEDTVIPPNGWSADKLAEQINGGSLNSAAVAALGFRYVKGMSAEVNNDGTLQVRIEHQTPDGDDALYAEVQHWPGAAA
jgi:hypothetical protein